MACACVALGAGVVSADAIEMDTCTSGWVWVRHGHGGACEPVACVSSADCGGRECVEVGRCVVTETVSLGYVPEDAHRPTYDRPLETLCSSDSECGERCRHASECAPPGQGMCSMGVGGRAPTSALVLVVSLAVLKLARRRG